MKKIKDLMLPTAHAEARSVANDPLQKFMFEVDIPSVGNFGFQSVSGLSSEIAVVEYFEGMSQYAYKLTGRESVEDITLERGVYGNNVTAQDFKKYYNKVKTDPACRDTVTIRIKDRFGNTRKKYTLEQAWCSKWEGTELDASSDDVAIETFTITFEYFGADSD